MRPGLLRHIVKRLGFAGVMLVGISLSSSR